MVYADVHAWVESLHRFMQDKQQDKQKVTLYLPPDLHRQLKIHAAMETEPMSAIAERAILFYLKHPEAVEEVTAAHQGNQHRIYDCPACATAVMLKEGNLVPLGSHPGILLSEEELVHPSTRSLDLEAQIAEVKGLEAKVCGEGELVPC